MEHELDLLELAAAWRSEVRCVAHWRSSRPTNRNCSNSALPTRMPGPWGLSCGGRIQVFVEPVDRMKSDVLSSILRAKRAKVPIALLTQLRIGEQIVVGPV